MAEDIETLVRGLEVDLGSIEKALALFWEGGDSAVATRASLVNLAIYSEQPGAHDRNSELISDLTREHACRAILVNADAASEHNRVRAWINAHCHITRAGAKQVCCEQVSFLMEGNSRRFLPNIVFAHLDSDLPLYLWWQGEFEHSLVSQIWGWVDRLIYDSREWREPRLHFDFLKSAVLAPRRSVALCDLDWTRIVYFRQGLAQIFDHPDAASQAARLDRVEIRHSAEARSTARLLAGWLAAQLLWTPRAPLQVSADADRIKFQRPEGGEVEVRFDETVGAPISEVVLHAPNFEVRVNRQSGEGYLHAKLVFGGECQIAQMLPAGGDSIVEVVNEELVRGGRHRLYLRALEKLGLLAAG